QPSPGRPRAHHRLQRRTGARLPQRRAAGARPALAGPAGAGPAAGHGLRAGGRRHGLPRRRAAAGGGDWAVSRRGGADAAVVGAGVVGAALALALARARLSVELVEAREPRGWDAGAEPELRVVA